MREPGILSRKLISDNADYRSFIRRMLTMKKGEPCLRRQRIRTQESVYEMYYDFEEPVSKAGRAPDPGAKPGRDGEDSDGEDTRRRRKRSCAIWREQVIRPGQSPYDAGAEGSVMADSYKRLIAPAIEREIRSELTEKAEDGAIQVFGKNLAAASDAAAHRRAERCLGWDPAFRTGCKLAVVDRHRQGDRTRR